ncbi:MAG: c-type cytochrome [Myxococcales bacterium]
MRRGASTQRGRIGVAVPVALAAAASIGGIVSVAAARAQSSPLRAEADGLEVRVGRALWVGHEREASGRIPHPHLPGMPEVDFDRLAVTVVLRNRATSDRQFIWQHLVLRSRAIDSFAKTADNRGGVVVPPGHTVVFDATFDVQTSPEPLTLWWQREPTAGMRLLETRTPVHPEPVPPREWPRLASDLPKGHARSGERLFHGRLACVSCHGDPAAPGSAGSAPDLGAIGVEAPRRVPGRSASQYLYESILEPWAFDATRCDAGPPCPPAAAPMPFYGEVISLQDAADLIAYLLEQRRAPRAQ